MSTRDVILSHPVRTAIGAYNGTLKNVPATELGAIVVREDACRRPHRGRNDPLQNRYASRAGLRLF
jgi:hypothetical protein